MTYWHFSAMVDGKPVMRDRTTIEIGKWYTVPEARMCETGFHGSRRAIDALYYAPGSWVSKRKILVTDTQDDKVVGTECVHLAGIDATEALRKFGRMCAFDVIDLWDAPPVVIKYLKTGDESLRAAVRAAAWAAAGDAAWDAARAAAGDAAGDGAGDAAWDAARAAAWDAARDGARAGARAAQNRRLTQMLNSLLRDVQ